GGAAISGELAPEGGGGVNREVARGPDPVGEQLVGRGAAGDAALLDPTDAVQDHAVLVGHRLERSRVWRDPHDPGAVAVVAGGQVQAAGVERPAVAADDVDAAGPGVQRVGEVAPALNAEDAVFGGEV